MESFFLSFVVVCCYQSVSANSEIIKALFEASPSVEMEGAFNWITNAAGNCHLSFSCKNAALVYSSRWIHDLWPFS